VDVSSLFVANAQAAKLTKPSKGSFNYPSPSAQPTAMFGVSLGQQRLDSANSQATPIRISVVATVAYHAIRPITWPSSFSLQDRDRINECEGLLRIVAIGSGETDSEGNSAPVTNQMTLAAELSPIGRIRAGLLPPKTARTEQLSTTARDQSI
jgi:hypothetical protein